MFHLRRGIGRLRELGRAEVAQPCNSIQKSLCLNLHAYTKCSRKVGLRGGGNAPPFLFRHYCTSVKFQLREHFIQAPWKVLKWELTLYTERILTKVGLSICFMNGIAFLSSIALSYNMAYLTLIFSVNSNIKCTSNFYRCCFWGRKQ